MKSEIFIFITMMLLTACSSVRRVPVTEKDSTRIETRVEHIFVHDTLFFEVPAQRAEVLVRDSTSSLENDFAISFAKVYHDGSLFHSLLTKPVTLPLPFSKPVERRDSIIYRAQEVQVPIPVECPLTKWQQACIRGYPISLCIILLLLLYLLRKPILALARMFI